MKKIGATDSGNILVELEQREYDAFEKFSQMVEILKICSPQSVVIAVKNRSRPSIAKAETKPAAAKPKPQPVQSDSKPSMVCPVCKKTFIRIRKDQKCCSVACRNRYKPPPKATPPAPTPAPRLSTVREIPDSTRLEQIRNADRRLRERSETENPDPNEG